MTTPGAPHLLDYREFGMGQHSFQRGDALERLRSLPDNSVDLCLTSPPYEDARTYGLGKLPKGQAWVDWCMPIYLECVRVTKGLVAWVVEGKTSDHRWSATPALFMADLHRAGVKLRKPPVYARVGIPGSGARQWLRNDYEFVVCASKGKLPWADNTACGRPPKHGPGGDPSHRLADGRRVGQVRGSPRGADGDRLPQNYSHPDLVNPGNVIEVAGSGERVDQVTKTQTRRKADGSRPRDGEYKAPKLANPGNVIRCRVGGGLMGSAIAHENEAPFPEALAEFFVRSFCPRNGVVLDCFGGSGTTAAVAARWGRGSVLFDVRDSQIALIQRRLQEAAVRGPAEGRYRPGEYPSAVPAA